MTLGQYVKKRNGVPLGHPKSLRNMLYRSLGAKNFSTFWMYWNPIFGYYLGRFIFKPLKKFISPALAIIITFVFCGAVHDLVTTIVRGSVSLFFATWFLLMGSVVVISNILKINFSGYPWLLRSIINLLLIGACFAITFFIRGGLR